MSLSSRSVLAFIPISTHLLFPLCLSPLQRSILTHLHWRRHDRFPSAPLCRPSLSLLPSLGVKWIGHAFRTSLDGASTSPPRPSWRSLARLLANACLNDICRSHAWFEAYYSGPHLCPTVRPLPLLAQGFCPWPSHSLALSLSSSMSLRLLFRSFPSTPHQADCRSGSTPQHSLVDHCSLQELL